MSLCDEFRLWCVHLCVVCMCMFSQKCLETWKGQGHPLPVLTVVLCCVYFCLCVVGRTSWHTPFTLHRTYQALLGSPMNALKCIRSNWWLSWWCCMMLYDADDINWCNVMSLSIYSSSVLWIGAAFCLLLVALLAGAWALCKRHQRMGSISLDSQNPFRSLMNWVLVNLTNDVMRVCGKICTCVWWYLFKGF